MKKVHYYNIMVNGYREHLIAPNCKTKEEAIEYAQKRKEAIQLMFDGIIPMDKRLSNWVFKKEVKENKKITVEILCQYLLDDYEEKGNKTYNKAVTHTVFFMNYFGKDTDIEKVDKFAIKKMKQELNFILLSDSEHKLSELYGVWKEKSMYGRKYMGIERSTFVLDADGKIEKEWRKVKVKGHVDEIIGYLTNASI